MSDVPAVGARVASPDDLPWLTFLADQALEEIAATKGGDVWVRREGRRQPVEASLREDLEAGDHLVVAGTLDDVVVGYAVAHQEPLPDGDVLGVVTDLFVTPEGRGVGVGASMTELLLTWAGEVGCMGVDSVALPGTRETKNFFESFGLTARAIVVHRRIDR